MRKQKNCRMFLCAAVLLCSLAAVSARGKQELVPSGHWIYDSMTAIALEQGILDFSGSAPLTIQELEVYLSEIEYGRLSESGKADFDKIHEYFTEEPFSFGFDILSVGFEPSLSLEGFYKTNDNLDWVYDRYSRHPLLDVPVAITCSDYVSMRMDLFLGQNKGASLRDTNRTNILYSADDFDINFPDTGYFSAGAMLTEKTGIGFQLGRGARSIGRTETGSMILSDYLTGVSYAQLQIFNPVLKYTGGVSQFNVDKYFYHHQLDVRLFRKVQVTVLEGLLVYAPLELRYLNPWMIFHGIAAWREYEPDDDDPESHTCDYLALSVQYTPLRHMRLYGTFAMTQFQTPYEKANYGDSPTPNGLGAQLGSEAYIPSGKGRFHLALEGSWANPYLYIKESPNWSLLRTYSENMGDKAIFYEWIGSPFGPDTISGELTFGYEVPQKWSVDAVYLFMARGENSGLGVFDRLNRNGHLWGGQKTEFDATHKEESNDHLANWAYPDNKYQDNWEELRDSAAPSGTPEFVNRVSVRGTWQPKPYLSLTVQPSFTVITNRNHERGKTAAGFEIAAAMSIQFAHLRKQ